MNKFLSHLLFPILCMLLTENVFPQKKTLPQIKWTTIAKLPNAKGQPSLGFAGAINGFSAEALIVAGGANFPGKMPWEQGKKHYSKEIHVLQKVGGNWQWNSHIKATLPEAIAYCGNTVTPAGIVYAGGENEHGISNKAYLLKWDPITQEIIIKRLPSLPKAVTNLGLTSIGSMVYAVGGDEQTKSSNQFLCIDLKSTDPKWIILPHLPVALANALVVAQYKGTEMFVYVIGGRSKNKTGISDLHHSTFAFDTKLHSWKSLASISDGKNTTNLSAAAGIAMGKTHILIPGSDDGKVFHQIELYLHQISLAKTDAERAILIAKKNELVIHHKGFNKGVLWYNTLTNKWIKISELPFLAPVTTTASKYGNFIILSNGEIKPGIRTPYIMLGELTP